MERIVDYNELPLSNGRTVYLRNETDPYLSIKLLSKGYRVITSIDKARNNTIYITGRRQDYFCKTDQEYREKLRNGIEDSLKEDGIEKPNTHEFSYKDLIKHKYKVPFVFKNENQNGGREKFLINNEEDYENLIKACKFLIKKNVTKYCLSNPYLTDYNIDYDDYLNLNFSIQEFVETPSDYNTTVRILTSSSKDLLYASLKYKLPVDYLDDTSLLGYLLHYVYPISTKSIVSNTLSGGKNILLGEEKYSAFEAKLLNLHNIKADNFYNLIESSKKTHEKFKSELGILCGFDFIYDKEKDKWFLLEYHGRPMVGDYSIRQGINYKTKTNRIEADGRVRATALSLTLKKQK